ncbi:MAG TPA: HAD family hydrolase [Anaerolineae bacterium]
MNSTGDMATSRQHYSTITFDMGFTLVDLHSGYDQELVRVAAEEGLAVTLDDARAAMRRYWQDQIPRDATATWAASSEVDAAMAFEIDQTICLNLGLRDPRIHRAVYEFNQRNFRDPANYQVFPDVFATLQTLRDRGLTLGIISNWGWYLSDLCEALALAPYFDFVISSARVGAAKPHAAIFQAALARAGSDPACTLHVGDTLAADVLGAQAVGITGVLLDRPGASQATGDYAVVSSLAEIPALL